jgi:UDP-2,3-diacylglucosamine pyrophosphatase LpxH
MYDAIIISDLHLGSDNCLARRIGLLLERIGAGELPTAKLILNGDVFDSIDFRRLKKSHWKVLSLLRKLSDQVEIIWLCGNHDGSAEVVSHLLGVSVRDEYCLTSGKEKILTLHGHTFDEFLDDHPVLTWVGDVIYFTLQRIDKSHYFAKLAKKGSKRFLRCYELIEQRSVEYARKKGCTAVCCGHTHLPVSYYAGDVQYHNSGCWTELPGTYLTVRDGDVTLHEFETAQPAGELAVQLAAPLAAL